ncbi:hypothetical protein E2562_036222 [Oryza meyeriana var. granulata]|uniref:3'-5' exonuclease domain-containing protein n=1 Tax=Oryza meyeriana var. granulata TaxID=110450 RepID=A0A6G1ETA7_9ORYZ|nr:hypothetical protein E2562_036222 [Oryza meyeriana var. granulata]
MAEEHLGLFGVSKSRRVGTSKWHAHRLTKGQVQYACVDTCLSFHLGVHLATESQRNQSRNSNKPRSKHAGGAMVTAATTVSTRLRRSTRTHDEYVVCVGGRQVVATVTSHAGAARRWVYTTRWRLGCRLRHDGGATVGMGVQWTPPFRATKGGAEPRPGTLQLCVGHRCLVFQLAHAGAVPAVLRRFLADDRVVFVAYGVRSDCRKLEEHHGLEVARTVELRAVPGIGNTSMERMAEEHLGWGGVSKPREVGTSRWDARRLTKMQVQYACVDAYLSFRLAVHVAAAPDSTSTSSSYSASASSSPETSTSS